MHGQYKWFNDVAGGKVTPEVRLLKVLADEMTRQQLQTALKS